MCVPEMYTWVIHAVLRFCLRLPYGACTTQWRKPLQNKLRCISREAFPRADRLRRDDQQAQAAPACSSCAHARVDALLMPGREPIKKTSDKPSSKEQLQQPTDQPLQTKTAENDGRRDHGSILMHLLCHCVLLPHVFRSTSLRSSKVESTHATAASKQSEKPEKMVEASQRISSHPLAL